MTYNTASQMTKWEAGANIEQSYDGDGLPAKRLEVRTSTPTFSSTIYYLRSSVLGGVVIADLNSSGQPQGAGQYRYIYANGGVLAREEFRFGVWTLNWQHVNGLTGDRVDGGVYKPLDPLGGLVGIIDPYGKGKMPTYAELVGERPFFLEEGNPFNAGVGCTLDGLPVDCNQLQQRAENQTVDITSTVIGEKRQTFYRAFLGGIYIETFGLAGYPDDLQEVFIENSFLNLAGSQQTARRGGNSASQPCTFNVNITNNAGLTDGQLERVQEEISRIFNTAKQHVIFGFRQYANGGSYHLTIQSEPPPSNAPRAVGSTPLDVRGGIKFATNRGFVSTQRLAKAIEDTTDTSDKALGKDHYNIATGIGRAAAHEVGHNLLNLLVHPDPLTVMGASFTGAAWWKSGYNSTFQFNKEQAQTLSRRCRVLQALTSARGFY
jgi:hypothetical protein